MTTLRARIERLTAVLHRLEDALLALLLGVLLLSSVAQIVLRLVFASGWSWVEPVSRMGVLWLALFGALAATRGGRHIHIDALPRLLRGRAARIAHLTAQASAALVCAFLAWFGYGMLMMEMQAPTPFVADIPSWVPMLAFPLGFALMAVRFVLAGLLPPHTSAGAPT